MALENFLFSQSSLQDFTVCHRRFLYRYIRKIKWPAVVSEPVEENEAAKRKGQTLHRLIYQHQVGNDVGRLKEMSAAYGMSDWFANYLAYVQPLMRGEVKTFPEYSQVVQIDGLRLTARYDLVVVSTQHAIIIDWKTSPHPTPKTLLAKRLQTRIYPFTLSSFGRISNSHEGFQPEQIEMAYFPVGFPENACVFPYDRKKYQEDREYFRSLMQTILGMPEEEFHLTENPQNCQFCVYRSLCDRGVQAGDSRSSELELDENDDRGLEWDFTAIPEVKE